MLDDTIVAISTPLGNSLRGIVRLSGERAFHLVQGATGSRWHTDRKYWQTGMVNLRVPPTSGIPAIVYLMPAPRSYTKEDVVEI
ncbi:MAG: tRNA uridine-5-carboxymethylaminomethyl(34) synthesis GTPase MnmE, partial [Planctomycetota bacterium]|nr:tRNA uridine-5-carboxymethylaminomethyl(34) synthesis GTPase MnmE [Planctomycetota bacterium]